MTLINLGCITLWEMFGNGKTTGLVPISTDTEPGKTRQVQVPEPAKQLKADLTYVMILTAIGTGYLQEVPIPQIVPQEI